MAYFDGIKVGDKVWDFVYGYGKVVDANYLSDFPIKVEFEESKNDNSYTKDGKVNYDTNQTLFWGKLEFKDNSKSETELEKENEVRIEKVFVLKTVENKYFTFNYVKKNDFNCMFGSLEYVNQFRTKEEALRTAEEIIEKHNTSLYLEELEFLY